MHVTKPKTCVGARAEDGAIVPDMLMRRAARSLFYLGVATGPLLVLRGWSNFLLSDLFLLGSLACTMLLLLERTKTPSYPPLGAVSAAVVLLGSMLALYRADSPSESFLVGIKSIFVISILPWQARHLLLSRMQLRAAIICWLVGAGISAAGAFAQAQFGPGVIPGGQSSFGRYSGFTQHVSDLGGVLASAIPIAVIMLVHARRLASKFALLGLVCIYAGGLVLSGSVSAFISVLLALLYAMTRGALPVRGLLVTLGISVASITLSATLNPASTVRPLERFMIVAGIGTSTISSQDTMGSRLATDQFALDGIRANPILGRGMDTVSGITIQDLDTHNLFLAAWYQGGLFLLVGILIALVVAIRSLFGQTPTRRDFLYEALISSFVGGLVFAMTAPSWYNRYFWLIPAFIVAASRLSLHQKPAVPNRSTLTGIARSSRLTRERRRS